MLHTQKNRRQSDYKDRDWSETAISWGMLAATRTGKRLLDSPLEPPQGDTSSENKTYIF